MKKLQAVLEISKIFFQRGGYACTLYPLLMDEVLSEEKASGNSLELIKWLGIFQVRIFPGDFPGESLAGIFQGEFFLEPGLQLEIVTS